MQKSYGSSQELLQNSQVYHEQEKNRLLDLYNKSLFLKSFNHVSLKLLENEASLNCATDSYDKAKAQISLAIQLVQDMDDSYMFEILNNLKFQSIRLLTLETIFENKHEKLKPLTKISKTKEKTNHIKTVLSTPKFTINIDESSPDRALSPVTSTLVENNDVILVSPEISCTNKVKRTPKFNAILKQDKKKIQTSKLSSVVISVSGDDSDNEEMPFDSDSKIKGNRKKIVRKFPATNLKSSKLTVNISDIGSQKSPKRSHRRRL